MIQFVVSLLRRIGIRSKKTLIVLIISTFIVGLFFAFQSHSLTGNVKTRLNREKGSRIHVSISTTILSFSTGKTVLQDETLKGRRRKVYRHFLRSTPGSTSILDVSTPAGGATERVKNIGNVHIDTTKGGKFEKSLTRSIKLSLNLLATWGKNSGVSSTSDLTVKERGGRDQVAVSENPDHDGTVNTRKQAIAMVHPATQLEHDKEIVLRTVHLPENSTNGQKAVSRSNWKVVSERSRTQFQTYTKRIPLERFYIEAPPRLHGVRPNDRALYSESKKKKFFTCLDASQKMPFSAINDNYCDCRDGSDEPGTSACPNGRFYCLGEQKFMLASRVNDGLCDCCDGSDEWSHKNMSYLLKAGNPVIPYYPCKNRCQVLVTSGIISRE